MMRIAHIITDTDTGGAELMLAKLIRNMDATSFSNNVLSLMPVEKVGQDLIADGFSVQSASLRPGLPSPFALWRIVRWIRSRRPVIVQTWMYHSDILGGIAGRYFAGVPVVWNIRQSNLNPQVNTRSTMRALELSRRLSARTPTHIVCGSEAAKKSHTEYGYAADKMRVIPNGFDTEQFKPDPDAKGRLCAELKIPSDSFLVGLAARLDPQKDHRTFIAAAKVLLKKQAVNQVPLFFVLCGENIEWNNQTLRQWIGDAPDGPIGRHFKLIARRHDLAKLYPAFDVSGTSSLGEGFPNVVGEAMACGTPCVVTDVGDSALIVGDTGLVVPPAEPEALAAAWNKLLTMSFEQRAELGKAARKRIETHYSMAAIAEQYQEMYRALFERTYGVVA